MIFLYGLHRKKDLIHPQEYPLLLCLILQLICFPILQKGGWGCALVYILLYLIRIFYLMVVEGLLDQLNLKEYNPLFDIYLFFL